MPTEPADPDELLAALHRIDPANGDQVPAQRRERHVAPPEQPPPGTGTAADEEPGRNAAVRRITFIAHGPALIEGPLELVTTTGAVIHADRFLVALCLCKRSANYPLCDTSHRRRPRRSRTS